MKKEISYKVWAKQGDMLVRSEALPYEHPDSVWQQLIAQGVNPEDYGFLHPLEERFGKLSRSDLINKILDLECEITGRERAYNYGAI